MATYNGHKNWNYWNVSLWISNDEGLYSLARELKHACGNSREAADQFIAMLAENGHTETPDGARYTKSAVAKAIAGL